MEQRHGAGSRPLNARVTVPDGVVFRVFPKETVVLNLETGKYHGLNPTGGRMLEVLQAEGTVDRAARRLSSEYGRPFDDLRRDLWAFCLSLERRGLIVLQSG